MIKPKLLTEVEVHEWLRIPIATLRTMRSRPGRDPIPYTKVGRQIRYREDMIEKWIVRNTFDSVEQARIHRDPKKAG